MDNLSTTSVLHFERSLEVINEKCEQIQTTLDDIKRQNDIGNIVNLESLRLMQCLIQKCEEFQNPPPPDNSA